MNVDQYNGKAAVAAAAAVLALKCRVRLLLQYARAHKRRRGPFKRIRVPNEIKKKKKVLRRRSPRWWWVTCVARTAHTHRGGKRPYNMRAPCRSIPRALLCFWSRDTRARTPTITDETPLPPERRSRGGIKYIYTYIYISAAALHMHTLHMKARGRASTPLPKLRHRRFLFCLTTSAAHTRYWLQGFAQSSKLRKTCKPCKVIRALVK